MVKCHESHEKAVAHLRALYANVEKETMATKKQREKRREHRLQKAKAARTEELEIEESQDEEEITAEEKELASLTEKDIYGDMPMMGPTSFEELDQLKEAVAREHEIREASWDVQDLVRNIIYHPEFSVEQKANAIKMVGNEFGSRVQGIMDHPVHKELDMDLLQIKAISAIDSRHTSVIEKAKDFITKKKLTASAENALPDSDFALVVERDGNKVRKYPIHDKAHVRNALSRAAQMIEQGGEDAADAKAALPKIKEAAKKMGIGVEKGLIVEKDASGAWRAVMFPTNNFKDWDGEILSEKAHLEYVEWVNKNMDLAPVFLTWHRAGTRREAQIDFVGYENGFLIMSAPLTEKEAAGLLRAQTVTDIGMSHGTFVLERDGGVINQYRMVEVSDLPLENAANPFTDFAILTKEANMDTKKYLAEVLGSDELAEKYLARTETKQKELRDAGVKEAEKPAETPAAPVQSAVAPATVQTNKDEIVAQVLKELDVEGLQEYLTKANEAIEKVPVLEGLVRDLSKSRDDQLVEVLTPKAERKFLWSKARASESKETVVTEKDEKLIKSVPGIDDEWASALGVTPLQ